MFSIAVVKIRRFGCFESVTYLVVMINFKQDSFYGSLPMILKSSTLKINPIKSIFSPYWVHMLKTNSLISVLTYSLSIPEYQSLARLIRISTSILLICSWYIKERESAPRLRKAPIIRFSRVKDCYYSSNTSLCNLLVSLSKVYPL